MTPGEELTQLRIEVGRQDERLVRVEEGVSNFRAFQTEVREFITRFDTREEARETARMEAEQRQEKRRERIHAAILGFIATVAAGGSTWGAAALIGWARAHFH